MNIVLTIHTDNGASVTVERSRVENATHARRYCVQPCGPEVDLRALDTLLTIAVAEVRAAYGMAHPSASESARVIAAVRAWADDLPDASGLEDAIRGALNGDGA